MDNLPDELVSYLRNSDWADKLDSLLVKYPIEEYKKIAIENEVLLVLIGLEPSKDLQDNIQTQAEIDFATAVLIAKDITKNIFDMSEAVFTKPEQPRSRMAPVGFEEAILNQAKAMRPAEPAGGRVTSYEVRDTNKKDEKPHNLPTEESHQIHDYKQGADPYREPVE